MLRLQVIDVRRIKCAANAEADAGRQMMVVVAVRSRELPPSGSRGCGCGVIWRSAEVCRLEPGLCFGSTRRPA